MQEPEFLDENLNTELFKKLTKLTFLYISYL